MCKPSKLLQRDIDQAIKYEINNLEMRRNCLRLNLNSHFGINPEKPNTTEIQTELTAISRRIDYLKEQISC